MFVLSRGNSKSATSYVKHLIFLYRQGKISQKDFITAIELAQIYLFGIPKEEVKKWIENQSTEYCNEILNDKAQITQ